MRKLFILLYCLYQRTQTSTDVSFEDISVSWSLTNTSINWFIWGLCEIHHDVIYLMSGGWQNYFRDSIYTFDVNTKQYELSQKTIPSALGFLYDNPSSKIKINNYLYFIPFCCSNGCNYCGDSTPFYRLNLDTLSFTTLTNKIDNVASSVLCYDKYNNTIYTVGGCCEVDTVLTYNIDNDQWSYSPYSLNRQRTGAYCTEFNYKIFTFVGNGYYPYGNDKRPEILDLLNIENGWTFGTVEIPLYITKPYVVELYPYPWILFMGGVEYGTSTLTQNKMILYDLENEQVKLIDNTVQLLPFYPTYGCMTYDYINRVIYYIGGEDTRNSTFADTNQIWKSLLTFNNNTLSPFTSTTTTVTSTITSIVNTTQDFPSHFTTDTQLTMDEEESVSDADGEDGIGMVVGIIFGVLVFIGLIIFGIIYVQKRSKTDTNKNENEQRIAKDIEMNNEDQYKHHENLDSGQESDHDDEKDMQLTKDKLDEDLSNVKTAKSMVSVAQVNQSFKEDSPNVQQALSSSSSLQLQNFTFTLPNGQAVTAQIVSPGVDVRSLSNAHVSIGHQRDDTEKGDELYANFQIEGSPKTTGTTATIANRSDV